MILGDILYTVTELYSAAMTSFSHMFKIMKVIFKIYWMITKCPTIILLLLCSGSLPDTGRIELSCEAESLHMKLSAVLGHSDQPQFPPSPPPPPTIFSSKRKYPSQLSRQERHCHVAVYFVEEHCMVDKLHHTK